MELENGQVIDAIKQVMVHCDTLMANYEMVSLRGALYTLGYNEAEANQIIRYVASKGFHYCVDPMIGEVGSKPSYNVCHWGPDQLKSRLQFIS